jgi:hypothetical protein
MLANGLILGRRYRILYAIQPAQAEAILSLKKERLITDKVGEDNVHSRTERLSW